MNSIFLISGTITFSHSIGKKMKHQYQSFTRIGRQFQSLERQVYADWTSVSFPFCQRSCLIWRIMTNTLTNTYVVIFLSVSIFGRGYHSRYQNFEFTGLQSLLSPDETQKDSRQGLILAALSSNTYCLRGFKPLFLKCI